MIIGIDASRAAGEDKTGTENYSYQIIKGLAEVDKENKYILYFNKVPKFFEVNAANFSTRIIPSPRLWTQARLALECLISPIDLLFVPAHTLPIIRRPNLRTVVTIHDLGAEFLAAYHQFPHKYYLNWSTRYAARVATRLIAVSNSTKKDLIDTFSLSPQKISVVYEGVDKEFFRPRSLGEIDSIRKKYGLEEEYLLFVGTIQPRKNLVALIKAFSELENKSNKSVELVLAGGKGWLDNEIYTAPNRFGVENRVTFLGYVPSEDLPALYSGALGFVFPSLYEGFGLPILEAFATECPVLTSAKGATAEIADKAAILVEPENISSLVIGLKKLLDKDIRKDLIRKGKERLKFFSWEKAARETLKVFEEAIKNKDG